MARNYVNLAEIYGAVDRDNANAMQMQNMQLQQQQLQRQNQREDTEYAEKAQLKDIYRRNITPDGKLNEEGLTSELYGVNPEAALKFQEQSGKRKAEQAKLQQEEAKFKMEQTKETFAYFRDRLATVRDDVGYQALMAEAQEQLPGLAKTAPPQYDPQWVQSNIMTASDVIKKMESELNRDVTIRGQDITIRGQDMTDRRTRDEGAANRGLTRRGQDLADKRGKEALELQKTKTPAGGKVSEGERKAATLLTRMDGSLKQLNTVLEKNPKAAKPELLSSGVRALTFGGMGGGEAAANTLTSGDRQRIEAAQLDILDAALTLGTGAAYTKEQLEGYRKSYFPQLGDDPQTVSDKKDRLENVLGAARVAAGNASPAPGVIPKSNVTMPNKPQGKSKLKPNADGTFNYGF
jgi:hypothetical protein